ncbi:DUF3262 family protein [Corticibacter populi]|uniref:DUF3262 family protein n=1 Tax=Corticibacter populi TaxID=1550736 RepID=A0A3M6QYY5_9BURK|nr:DUF3262 family protein [Corticibacter populi]RMX08141.1 DUF3262 family protein [Corticibacter populi]RZS35397.1 uncharacterized protein DUF3262 [Corticibacter populi]
MSTNTLFSDGSGVDASVLAVTLQSIGSVVAIMVFAWIVGRVLQAYQSEQLKAGEAIWQCVKAVVVLMFVLTAIFVV